ncbi:ATP-binding protein [Aeromicrobium sp. UC242_57]|uniref:DUF4194 domain-containing protein n=1 Tax=Aeromicrobium sp. UC242_57 TaxID=3374624 RepID=UPI0037A44094
MLILLRRHLTSAESDAVAFRVVVTTSEMVEWLTLYHPEGTSPDKIGMHVASVERLGYLRKLRGHEDTFEIRRIVKAVVTSDWIAAFGDRLMARSIRGSTQLAETDGLAERVVTNSPADDLPLSLEGRGASVTSTNDGVEAFGVLADLEALPLTKSAELEDTGSASLNMQADQPTTGTDREGVRLEQFQMLNWGTFDRVVQRLRMFSGNALLTGQIGAGKSTVVDGLTTLFADTSRVTFNLAAGADRRERTLASYVLGTYGRTRDPETGADKPETLRNTRNAYSVLLARFTGLASDTGVMTAGVVFWFPENGTNPNKPVLHLQDPSRHQRPSHWASRPPRRTRRAPRRGCGTIRE